MIRAVEARNASLDNDYGTTRGANAADEHEVALFDADGVELDDATSPGYARVTVVPADWPAAADGAKTITVTFDPPTAPWVPAVEWRLIGDDGFEWDSALLTDPLDISDPDADYDLAESPEVDVTVQYETTES